jgi:hypothetical protein
MLAAPVVTNETNREINRLSLHSGLVMCLRIVVATPLPMQINLCGHRFLQMFT